MSGIENKSNPSDAPPEKSGRGRPSVKPRLLDEALAIVAEEGIAALTYDSLAERTGVSKGGLLYHFASKEALLNDITERLISRYNAAREEAVAALPPGRSRALKGAIMASLNNSSKSDNVSAKMITSGHWSPDRGRKYRRERFDEMVAGVGFERAAVVYLATEGLWFMELADRSPFTSEERQRIADLLLALADGAHIQDPEEGGDNGGA